MNRPTPGSQRPAEPVASGFSPGVNSPVFMGQFWSLGVKPWVREQENPGIPGNIRGSNCGFDPKSEGEKAYDRTKIPVPEKRKFALWISKDTIEKAKKHYKDDNCSSASEFIEKAILFYLGYLSSQENQDYLAQVIPPP